MIALNQFTSSILPFTLKYEGGYANEANDKGGETYRGISRKFNPNWSGWSLVDILKPSKGQIVAALEPDVEKFYWQRFLNYGFDKVNSAKVGLAMFDYNVHGGFDLNVMKSIIQNKFGKIVTPDTLTNWVNSQNEDAIANAILEHRSNYLKNIIAKDPTQKKFEAGWNSRLQQLKAALNIKTVGISAGILIIILIAVYFLFIRKEKSDENNQDQQPIETYPGEVGQDWPQSYSGISSN